MELNLSICLYIVTWYATYLNQQALRLTVKMVGERRGKLSALCAVWSVE